MSKKTPKSDADARGFTEFLGDPERFRENEAESEFAERFDNSMRTIAQILLNTSFKRVRGLAGIQTTDVVQEAYLEVRRRIESMQGTSEDLRKLTWLMMEHHLLNLIEREQAQQRRPDGGVASLDALNVDIKDSSHAWYEERVRWLKDQLEELAEVDENQASIVQLTWSGFSMLAIERRTGIERRRAKKLLEKGQEWLAERAADTPWSEVE